MIPTRQQLHDLVVAKQRHYAILLRTSARSEELDKLSREIGELNQKIYGQRR